MIFSTTNKGLVLQYLEHLTVDIYRQLKEPCWYTPYIPCRYTYPLSIYLYPYSPIYAMRSLPHDTKHLATWLTPYA